MPGQRSPYSVLGLKPGADPASVDAAHRQLMRRHHPDMPGGEAGAAAEINQAYAALKGRTHPRDWRLLPALEGRVVRRQARRRGRLLGVLLLGLAVTAMLMVPEPSRRIREALPLPSSEAARPAVQTSLPDTLDMRSLPDEQAIASAVLAARRIHAAGQGAGAAEFSRNCQRDLANYPSPAMLDHCVAFDAATALLGGRQAGPEFEVERMGERHARAAAAVSGDPVLAQNRIVSARRAAERLLTSAAG